MDKLTKADYEALASAFKAKGMDTDQAYKVMESHNWSVTLNGKLMENIYASRVLAIMHKGAESFQL